MRRANIWYVVVVAFCCSMGSAPLSASPVLYSVRAQALTSAATGDSNQQNNDSGAVQQPSVSEQASVSNSAPINENASAHSSLTVAPGIMHAIVSADCGPNGGTGDGEAIGTYTDTLNLSSSTLSSGSIVQLDVAGALDFALTQTGSTFPRVGYNIDLHSYDAAGNPVGEFFYNYSLANGNPLIQSGTMSAVVGGTVSVSANLDLDIVAEGESGSGTIDASDTASLTMSPDTSDFTFSSASGASYAVPEPASLGLALLPLILIRRRRGLAAE